MKLKAALARARIFVGTDRSLPAARPAETMLVGTSNRLVPTVYEELRAQKRRRRWAMALFIATPTLLASIYYGLIASPRFTSETQMVLSEQSGPTGGGGATAVAGLGGTAGSGVSSLLSLVGASAGGSDAANNAAIVTSYLQSVEAVEAADKAIGLRKMWSSHTIDFFSRMSSSASKEDFFKYYQRHVTIVSDPTEPVIELQVQAFEPKDAQLIAATLVRLSQDKLNTAFNGMREDALTFARSEVAHGQQQLAAANEKLRNFRNAHRDLDPTASAQGVGTVEMALFGQLASTEADLKTMLSYARPDSAAVKNLKARVEALKKQVDADREMMAGDPKSNPLANEFAEYQNLLLDQTFGQDAYSSAMGFLEQSRTALAHQHAYLIDFLAPDLPEEATQPKIFLNIVLALVVSSLMWLVGSLVVSALREHAHR